jgi:hypothetical protein
VLGKSFVEVSMDEEDDELLGESAASGPPRVELIPQIMPYNICAEH